MALAEYHGKRHFDRTPEPRGGIGSLPGGGWSFVIQKHAARRLHYDFRLELDGVLKSWAVTKGPSLDPADKRLAVQVEDHPLEYGGFEGIIPKGEYGGGTVLLWDRGTWEPVGDPHKGLAEGHLKFHLDGEKLKGGWALVRLRQDPKNWLLIKERDADARPGHDILSEQPLSVASHRPLDDITADPKAIHTSHPNPAGDLPGAKAGKLPAKPELMLCTRVDHAPAGDDWLHEIKFDGYRLMCRIDNGEVRLFTRGGLDWTAKFAAIARAAGQLPLRQALIDGEAVVLAQSGASDFGALQAALSEAKAEAILFFAFDLLHLDGLDLTESPLVERKRVLAELVGEPPSTMRYSDHVRGRGPEFARNACAFALEGVVSKRADSLYRPGRGRDWLKWKCTARQELVIAGFTPPSSGSSQGFGALLLGYWDEGEFRYAGKVGTGFTERVMADLFARMTAIKRTDSALVDPPKEKAVTWIEPKLVAEVEFTEWTSDGRLRHPSYQGLREDKDPTQITREAPAASETAAPPGRKVLEQEMEARLNAFRFTNPDRMLWQDQGVTKRGLAAYYAEVAPLMLAQVSGRPLALVRCPEGQAGDCFFQRHAGQGMNGNIKTVPVPGDEPNLWIDSVEGLFALAQMGVLEIHNWGCEVEDIERPDRLCFDLDPDPDLPWARVVEGANEVKARLEALGLKSFLKTTGGKGLHVVVPIEPQGDWEWAKEFCKAFADKLAQDLPHRFIANMSKVRRSGLIFLDYLRNGRAATWIAPYSTRSRPGAPVSVPLAWGELESGLRSDHFTVVNVGRRLSALGRDPWSEMGSTRQSISPEARKALGLAP